VSPGQRSHIVSPFVPPQRYATAPASQTRSGGADSAVMAH
jgi:hypothetical protein